MGERRLPKGPHVVVLPPGLIAQWQAELHRFLPPMSFTILPYQGNFSVNNRKAIWALAQTSQVPVILLVAQGAVSEDGKTVLSAPTKMNQSNEFTELSPKKTKVGVASLPFSLFNPGVTFGTVIVDEIHIYRGRPAKRLYVSAIIAKAFYAIGMSATPIITAPIVRVRIGGPRWQSDGVVFRT